MASSIRPPRAHPNRSHAERTGIVTSDKSVTASSLIVGPTLVLDAVTKLGLGKVLNRCFPETSGQILAMAYHLVCRGDALSHFPEWAKTHRNPSAGVLTTQRISDLLAGLGEDGCQIFLVAWLWYRSESEYLCFDITSVSSYSTLNEHVKYGENRDSEDLPQINLVLLFGQKSMIPVYYRDLPGNISDVRTLKNLLNTFGKLGMPKVHLVMDRDFYSKKNTDDLLAGDTSLR